jgi:AraC-like DNA-binding protein
MGSGSGGKPIPGEEALPALWSGRVKLASFGGGGETTGLVCGYLACDGELLKPVLAGLPRVVRVNIRTDPSGEWLDNMLRHAVSQAAASTPGSDVIVAHLAEVLFTEVLRRYLLSLPEGRTGWLAGAGDPAVGRALAALHRDPCFDWTLELLAQEARISRSALTEKFTRFIGQAPMAYLTDWRLQLGAEALRTTSRSVQRVALDAGYDSEAAFNRAFKRRFSVPPARYRRESREKLVTKIPPRAEKRRAQA